MGFNRTGNLQVKRTPTLQDVARLATVNTVRADLCFVTVLQPRVSAPSLGLSSLAAASTSTATITLPDGSGAPVLAPPPCAGAVHAPLLAESSVPFLKSNFLVATYLRLQA